MKRIFITTFIVFCFTFPMEVGAQQEAITRVDRSIDIQFQLGTRQATLPPTSVASPMEVYGDVEMVRGGYNGTVYSQGGEVLGYFRIENFPTQNCAYPLGCTPDPEGGGMIAIPWFPLIERAEIYNDGGERIGVINLSEFAQACGNRVCESGEEMSCAQDCPTISSGEGSSVTPAPTIELEKSGSDKSMPWGILLMIGLVIGVLGILVIAGVKIFRKNSV